VALLLLGPSGAADAQNESPRRPRSAAEELVWSKFLLDCYENANVRGYHFPVLARVDTTMSVLEQFYFTHWSGINAQKTKGHSLAPTKGKDVLSL
jgi:hypothetical protein